MTPAKAAFGTGGEMTAGIAAEEESAKAASQDDAVVQATEVEQICG